MSKKIKVIWDFRGPNASHTAIHHEKHLKEYMFINELIDYQSGVSDVSEMHSTAHLIISEDFLPKIKADLRPQRGELVDG